MSFSWIKSQFRIQLYDNLYIYAHRAMGLSGFEINGHVDSGGIPLLSISLNRGGIDS